MIETREELAGLGDLPAGLVVDGHGRLSIVDGGRSYRLSQPGAARALFPQHYPRRQHGF